MHGSEQCPDCGRGVDLDRNGRYRRHYVVDHDGSRRLCSASRRCRLGVVRLLRVEPTAAERYSHALRLLAGVERRG